MKHLRIKKERDHSLEMVEKKKGL